MRFTLSPLLTVALLVAGASPALAIMRGEVARNPNGLRQSVVRVESSTGEMCSGAVIAPDLVLTAAHCVDERATYRVVVVDRRFRQYAVRAVAAAMHPAFVAGTTPRTQPGVDLALIKLEQPLNGDFVALDPRRAGRAGRGEPVSIAGFGVEAENRRASARVLRQTQVVSIGTLQVANRVDVVVDGKRLARTPGAGACRGDSGGPIVRGGPGGYQLVGIVSWSSGAMASRERTACGGLTAVTPVADHASWIAARAADLQRLQPGYAAPQSAQGNASDWRDR
jgi:secreted trypsin-like serine protease